jgi:type I restriction enzyme S subunit
LPVQEEIASLLGALDDRIDLLRETNATLEAIAQALFKSWFIDFDPVRAKQKGLAPAGMDEATAALFPDGFEESELGLLPRGWRVGKFEDFIRRLTVGKKFDQKTVGAIGAVPVLDQGKSGVIGFHNEAPGVHASLENPVLVFANHTCYMRLITFDFSAIQNVLPFVGLGVDTVWAFYATRGRMKFSEYKGHWPDFAIEKMAIPSDLLTLAFRGFVDPLMRGVRSNELQAQTLATLRDTLLPRLISGQLRLPEAESLAATG